MTSPEITHRARVSRATNDMICGVADSDLLSDLADVGCGPSESLEILEEARRRSPKIKEEYISAVRTSALVPIMFGLIFIGILLLVNPEKLPVLRHGRYVIGWIIGFGALLYGSGRWLFPEVGLKPIRGSYSAHR